MLLKMDNTSGRKTLHILHNFMQGPVVNTLFQEKKKHHNQKDGSKGTPKLGPYWELQPVTCIVSMELDQNLVFEQRQFSLLSQNFSWIKYVCDEFEQQ